MFRSSISVLLLSALFFLTGCSGDSQKVEPAKVEAAQTTPAVNPNLQWQSADPRNIDYTPEEVEIYQRFNDLLTNSSKVEYVFYLPGYSMSTEMEDPAAIRNFLFYAIPKTPARTDCDLEVGMAFRDKVEGEIHLTIDAVVTKPDCRYAKVTFVPENKSHNMIFTDAGYQHIMRFMQIKPGDGTPVAK